MKYTWRPSVATSTRGQPVGGTGTARRCRRPADEPAASGVPPVLREKLRLTVLSVVIQNVYMGRTTISVRELQQNLKGVMARVEQWPDNRGHPAAAADCAAGADAGGGTRVALAGSRRAYPRGVW